MRLIEHLKEYVKEVRVINNHFKKQYSTTDVMKSVKLKKILQEGMIDNGKYYFHGIGCRVIYPDRTINFDYSPKGVSGGFGLYDIIDYLESKGENIAKEEIEKELNKLKESGDILYPKLPPNESLYYLKDYEKLLSPPAILS